MKYAVIQLQGKQYRVEAGEELVVDRLTLDEGKTFEVEEVLLVVDGDKRQIGQPLVKEVKVKCKVLGNGKGPKIRVAKYKAKSRYRKVLGHRQLQSTIKVVSIS